MSRLDDKSRLIHRFHIVCPRHSELQPMAFWFRNVLEYQADGITLYGYKCPDPACGYQALIAETNSESKVLDRPAT